MTNLSRASFEQVLAIGRNHAKSYRQTITKEIKATARILIKARKLKKTFTGREMKRVFSRISVIPREHEENFRKAMEKLGFHAEDSLGFMLADGRIIIFENTDRSKVRESLRHEIAHYLKCDEQHAFRVSQREPFLDPKRKRGELRFLKALEKECIAGRKTLKKSERVTAKASLRRKPEIRAQLAELERQAQAFRKTLEYQQSRIRGSRKALRDSAAIRARIRRRPR
jgi:hypothetical protein